jgi:hypothetical protein
MKKKSIYVLSNGQKENIRLRKKRKRERESKGLQKHDKKG